MSREKSKSKRCPHKQRDAVEQLSGMLLLLLGVGIEPARAEAGLSKLMDLEELVSRGMQLVSKAPLHGSLPALEV